jgi:hypothetical protein
VLSDAVVEACEFVGQELTTYIHSVVFPRCPAACSCSPSRRTPRRSPCPYRSRWREARRPLPRTQLHHSHTSGAGALLIVPTFAQIEVRRRRRVLRPARDNPTQERPPSAVVLWALPSLPQVRSGPSQPQTDDPQDRRWTYRAPPSREAR